MCVYIYIYIYLYIHKELKGAELLKERWKTENCGKWKWLYPTR